MIKKISDKEMDRVAGGVDPIENNKTMNESHDENWKKRIREAAELYDDRSKGQCRACVCGTCPGCGKRVGYRGDVCSDCRKESGYEK